MFTGNKVILASRSVGRQRIFDRIFPRRYIVLPSTVDETEIAQETSDPYELVVKLAEAKAESVSVGNPFFPVFAFDTIVIVEGKILGKPSDKDEAKKMIKHISGKIHRVVSSFAFHWHQNGLKVSGYDVAELKMKPLSDDYINRYVETHPVTLWAGGYAIQENDEFLTLENGDVNTVIGIPLEKMINDKVMGRILRKLGAKI